MTSSGIREAGNSFHRYSIGVAIEQRTWSQARELEDSQSLEGWIRCHSANYLLSTEQNDVGGPETPGGVW
jgi:hypothetical protein